MNSSKLLGSVIAAVLFAVFASPYAFSMTQRYVAGPLRQQFVRNGVPTLLGLGVHAVLFVVVLRLLLD